MPPLMSETMQSYAACRGQLPEFVLAVADVPGDFAEFGVYNGGTVRLLAGLAPDRMVWAFDTYQGMPKEDYNEELDGSDPPGKWAADAGPSILFQGNTNIQPVVGRFAETLPNHKPLQLAFVHLDCDWYASYRQVLTKLNTWLSPGAIVAVDDYSQCAGARKAMDEWMRENRLEWVEKWWLWWPCVKR